MLQKTSHLSFILILGLFIAFINPVKAQTVTRILALGNSITNGYTASAPPSSTSGPSYRKKLYNLLIGAGFQFDFVGYESTGCDGTFTDCQHGGINGLSGDQLVTLLSTGQDIKRSPFPYLTSGPYLDYYTPDVILLHIGTNDVTQDAFPTIADVSTILDQVDAYESRAGKTVTVFLAQIINRKVGAEKRTETTEYNNLLKTMAETRISTKGDKIILLDMENDAGFLYTDTDMTDDLHPNTTGYEKMADLWFEHINSFNTAPVISTIPNQTAAENSAFADLNLNNYVSDNEDADADITWSTIPSNPVNFKITISNNIAKIEPRDPDWNGSETIIFKALDKGVNGAFKRSDRDTVVFTVTPVNDAPVFTSTPITSILVDSAYSYTVTATDAENQSITYSAVALPSWLTFNTSTHILSGTPGSQHLGDHTVTLRAFDGSAGTNQTFSINVHNYSFIPVITGVSKTLSTFKNIPVTISLTDLLVTDEDNVYPDDFELTLINGTNYTFSGSTVYPSTNFTGTLKVHLKVFDGTNYSASKTIDVIVSNTVNITNDVKVADEVIIYPNPASGWFNVVISEENPVQLIIFNSVGICVYNQLHDKNERTIEINTSENGMGPGIYFYRIATNGNMFNGKIIIQ